MRALLINGVCGVKSTGRICTDIAASLEAQGYEVKIAYGRETVPQAYQKYAVKIGNELDFCIHAACSMLLDMHGLASVRATKQFIRWAEKYNPDLLWLHNLHGYYINYRLLFNWIKTRPQMQVKWTLHDCWAFTGRCSHYMMAGCDKWKSTCDHCPQKHKYPATYLLDGSKRNLKQKHHAFGGVKNMTIITPSRWLAEQVKQSFLAEYPVTVQHNTVDTNVFRPTESDFRKAHSLDGKKIILGVAAPWSKEKGLDDYVRLSALLDDVYQLVLVGLNQKQLAALPPSILGLERTDSVAELAAIYSAADVYLNLTYEDNYPTTNLEAQACGTPVITYRTGGSPESVPTENVVPCGDVVAAYNAVVRLCETLSEQKTADKSGTL